ncbi:putative sucrose-phosphate synthase 2, partial [Ananas comosus]
MAVGNEWINGYLEAILDSGGAAVDEQRGASPKVSLGGRGHFNPTKYFVEEVVTGVDESDLYRTWAKVSATRNSRERSTRLENTCWRIWHLARKKKQDVQRRAYRRWELEQGWRDATEDMSEDLSEGEKGDVVGEMVQTPRKRFQRNFSDLQTWSDDNKGKKLYIVLIRDLNSSIILLCNWSYAEPTEMLTPISNESNNSNEEVGESGGAYIVRIPFGPTNEYLRKEQLWPYIQEFVDGALAHILNMSRVLGEQIGEGKPVWPYVIHGHYADAGDAAALLSGALNVPMVLTGHSLGRNKLEQLLKQGRQSMEDIDAMYKIMRRIEAEELSLDAAELVITSTKQEIEEQWGMYDGFDVKLERVLRARNRRGVDCHGRYMPRMAVIPPGMDFSNVEVQEDATDMDGESAPEGSSPRSISPICSDVMRFFTNPHKPMILALSRPDPKKNITTLVKAFGECRPLRELANLTLIMGNRDDIDEMSSGNANVLTTVLKLIDRYDLYGFVAYPKHHKQSDVPDIYRLAAKTKGVFINPALVEPFGLTLIEAAAHGLPMVATKNGGPVDIHRALNNGLLIDPHDQNAIADALLKLLADKNLWYECRKNGWRNIHLFSWPEHCRTYLTRIAACRMRHPQWQMDSTMDDNVAADDSLGDSLKDVQESSLRLSVDIENKEATKGEGEVQDQVKHIMDKIKRAPDNSHKQNESLSSLGNKYPILRKRRRLFVIAVDCYTDSGGFDKKMTQAIEETIKAVKSDPHLAKISGFVLSTAMPMNETLESLNMGNIHMKDFDALICSSGSEMYYPGSYSGSEEDSKFSLDFDYAKHIEYRWGHEGVKRTIVKLMNSQDGQGENKSESSVAVVDEDEGSSNGHCVSFLVKDKTKAMPVDKLREKLRIRGLRCHLMYCRNSTRLQVIPLLASRSQALRYLFVRWGVNVANMYIIAGEKGDTDLEELLSGSQKKVILKGAVERGSEELLRTSGSYKKKDIVPADSPFIFYTNNGFKSADIAKAIQEASKAGYG